MLILQHFILLLDFFEWKGLFSEPKPKGWIRLSKTSNLAKAKWDSQTLGYQQNFKRMQTFLHFFLSTMKTPKDNSVWQKKNQDFSGIPKEPQSVAMGDFLYILNFFLCSVNGLFFNLSMCCFFPDILVVMETSKAKLRPRRPSHSFLKSSFIFLSRTTFTAMFFKKVLFFLPD